MIKPSRGRGLRLLAALSLAAATSAQPSPSPSASASVTSAAAAASPSSSLLPSPSSTPSTTPSASPTPPSTVWQNLAWTAGASWTSSRGGVMSCVEGSSTQFVCVALQPAGPYTGDLAVPGKFEASWGACNVAQLPSFAGGGGCAATPPGLAGNPAGCEYSTNTITKNFAVLAPNPLLVWGASASPPVDPQLGPATGPVTYPGATVGGTPVTVCRAYVPLATAAVYGWGQSGPHAGFAVNGSCYFSWGGAPVVNGNGGFDSLWLLPVGSSLAPVTTPQPSNSVTPSASAPAPTPSPTSTPATPLAYPELWLDAPTAAARGFQNFVQSGVDSSYYSGDAILVCRGLLSSNYSGVPSPSASASPSPLSLSGSAAITAAPARVMLAATPAATIALPGVSNAPGTTGANVFDHMDYDPVGKRLFVAAKQANSVVVIDAVAMAVLQSLSVTMTSPQGVRVVPSLGLVLITSDFDGLLRAFSLTPPFALAWTVTGLENADNLAFDATTNTAWVSAGGSTMQGGLYSVLCSATSGTTIGNIAFPVAPGATGPWAAQPQDFRLSPTSSLIYAAQPSTNSIVVASRTSLLVLFQWPLQPLGASTPSSVEIDGRSGRLFVTAYGTAVAGVAAATASQLLVLNLWDGSLVWSMPTPTSGCNQVQADPNTGAIFVSCGGSSAAGDTMSTVYIAQQLGASTYAARGAAPAPASLGLVGARTSVYDPVSQTLFVGVPAVASAIPPQPAQVLALRSSGGQAPAAATGNPFGLPAVLPGRYDSFAGSCVVPFNANDAVSYGPTIIWQLLVFSPYFSWSTGLAALPAGGRAVLSGVVSGRNATVCRAFMPCGAGSSYWCSPSGPHAGYVFLSDPVPTCFFSYVGLGTVVAAQAPNFDVLYSLPSLAAAANASQLALPSASITPTTSATPSGSMNASVPGVQQWIQGGTADAVFAGNDGSSVLTVCRGQVGTELVPGKRLGSSPYCDVPVRGAEVLDVTFASLRSNAWLVWVAANNVSQLSRFYTRVVGGSYQTVPATVCRAFNVAQGTGPHPGFTDGLPYGSGTSSQQLCFFSWGGGIISNAVFDVLYMAPAPSPTPTPSRSPSPTTTPISPTPSPTPSVTPFSPSSSGTRTPSETCTPTRSPSKTPTPSTSPSASPSIGASPTSTTSITPSSSSTVSVSPVIIIAAGYTLSNSAGGPSGVVLVTLGFASIILGVVGTAYFLRPAAGRPAAAGATAGDAAKAGEAAEGEHVALSEAAPEWSRSEGFSYAAVVLPGATAVGAAALAAGSRR